MITEPIKRRDVLRRGYRFRSAIDGRFVTRMWALFHPATTVKEQVQWP